MDIQFIASLFIAFAILLILIAAKTMLKRGWFMKWLRGMLGFFAITATVLCSMIALDLFSYTSGKSQSVVATLTFAQNAEQDFEVELVSADNERAIYRLFGDQWQLDVRLLSSGFVNLSKGVPSFKLDRLSGRYLSLELEKHGQRSVYDLVKNPLLDTWGWVSTFKLDWILQAQNGSAAFMPMVDGGIYQVALIEGGLRAKPVNDIAKQAVINWQ